MGRFYSVCILKSMRYDFFARPLRVLNEIFDLPKATSARPRKLGLRPQTVRVRPLGRYLRPRQVPKNFIGPLRGRAGFGVKISNQRFLRGFPCENLARQPSPRVKHFGLSEPAGRVSEMYRGRPSLALRIFAGCPSLGHLSWARKKGDDKFEK